MGKKATTVNNFNIIRPALLTMHKLGNKKPLNADICVSMDIDSKYLTDWENCVNSLRVCVQDYVKNAMAAKYHDDITPAMVQASREQIYPRWKSILGHCEASKDKRALHVSEFDVEALIKFAWTFADANYSEGETYGTYMCNVKPNEFRRWVEAYVGVLITKQELTSDEDRDAIQAYVSAQKSKASALDKIAEIQAQINGINEILKKIPETETVSRAYFNKMLAEYKLNLTDAEAKLADADTRISKTADAGQKARAKLEILNQA